LSQKLTLEILVRKKILTFEYRIYVRLGKKFFHKFDACVDAKALIKQEQHVVEGMKHQVATKV